MRLRRRPAPAAAPEPRPDHVAIAVMEYEELGIKPEPGSTAAAIIACRTITAALCEHAQVVDITTFEQPGHVGFCTRCGTNMIQNCSGEWEQA